MSKLLPSRMFQCLFCTAALFMTTAVPADSSSSQYRCEVINAMHITDKGNLEFSSRIPSNFRNLTYLVNKTDGIPRIENNVDYDGVKPDARAEILNAGSDNTPFNIIFHNGYSAGYFHIDDQGNDRPRKPFYFAERRIVVTGLCEYW